MDEGNSMKPTLSKLGSRLKALCDQTMASRQPIRICRRSGEDVVLVAADEFDSLVETVHLLSSPKNAARLLTALARACRRE